MIHSSNNDGDKVWATSIIHKTFLYFYKFECKLKYITFTCYCNMLYNNPYIRINREKVILKGQLVKYKISDTFNFVNTNPTNFISL